MFHNVSVQDTQQEQTNKVVHVATWYGLLWFILMGFILVLGIRTYFWNSDWL